MYMRQGGAHVVQRQLLLRGREHLVKEREASERVESLACQPEISNRRPQQQCSTSSSASGARSSSRPRYYGGGHLPGDTNPVLCERSLSFPRLAPRDRTGAFDALPQLESQVHFTSRRFTSLHLPLTLS